MPSAACFTQGVRGPGCGAGPRLNLPRSTRMSEFWFRRQSAPPRGASTASCLPSGPLSSRIRCTSIAAASCRPRRLDKASSCSTPQRVNFVLLRHRCKLVCKHVKMSQEDLYKEHIDVAVCFANYAAHAKLFAPNQCPAYLPSNALPHRRGS